MIKEEWPMPNEELGSQNTHEVPPVNEVSETHKKSAIGRWIANTAIAAGSLVGFGAGEQNTAEAQTPQGAVVATNLYDKFMNAGGTATETIKRELGNNWNWEIYHTFFKKDKQGKEVFNPGALLAPFEVVGTKEIKTAPTAHIAVPYEYSRLYDTAQTLDPEAKRKTEDYIQQQLLQAFGENVHNYGFFLTNGVLEAKRPLDTGLGNISSVVITGSSSPEGNSAASLVTGNLEQENTDLALRRANNVREMLPDQVLDQNPVIVEGGVETQFTDEELVELSDLATSYLMEKYDPGRFAGSTGVNYVNILEMTKDFNAGKIETSAPNVAPKITEALSRLVAAKRNVQMEVEGENAKKETYVFPLPLALLLLLIPRRRRNIPVPPAEQAPVGDLVAEPLPFPNTPENPDSGEFWIARQQTLRDLYEAFDNPEALALGVNYRQICEQVDQNFERFRTQEDRLTWISHRVLEQWATSDAKKMNIDVNELIHKYKNDPKQLFYALLHARELNDAVVDLQNNIRPDERDDFTATIRDEYFRTFNQLANATTNR